jgi:hypothetical protein
MISALFMYMYIMKLVSIYQRCQLSNQKVHNYSYHISFFLLVRRRWVLANIWEQGKDNHYWLRVGFICDVVVVDSFGSAI